MLLYPAECVAGSRHFAALPGFFRGLSFPLESNCQQACDLDAMAIETHTVSCKSWHGWCLFSDLVSLLLADRRTAVRSLDILYNKAVLAHI